MGWLVGSLWFSSLVLFGAVIAKNEFASKLGGVDSISSEDVNIPQSQYNALFDLYQSTNGTYWTYDTSTDLDPNRLWNFTSYSLNHPCSDQWYGISCLLSADNTSVSIQELILHNFELSGTIPDSIGVFTNLVSLALDVNNLYGGIPLTICDLTSLQVLDVSGNDLLAATIPECISELNHLTDLSLWNTGLHGTVPYSIGNLTSLQYLALNDNSLTGTLPASIGNCMSLIFLDISDNFFNGTLPETLGNLQSLTDLAMGSNRFVGTLPNSMSKLINLETWYAGENGFTGPIPRDIGNLQSLTALHLYSNQLSQTIPESYYNLTQLVLVYLTDNRLTGTLSNRINNFRRAISINVDHNQLHGPLPDTFSELVQQLQEVDLSYNYFDSSIPDSYCELSGLWKLFMQYNSLTGTVPLCLSQLTQLMKLQLQHNFLSGPLPYFPDSSQLSLVYLDQNQFTGTTDNFMCGGPGEGATTALNLINLNFNLLTGTLSNTCLQPFIQFQVSNNLLSGTLPSKLSELAQLETVFVNKNIFTGRLDTFFDSAVQTRLVNVDVSDNQLTGQVPSVPFEISTLQSFAAVSNCFSGQLPIAEMCGALSLITLALDGLMSASSCQNRFFAPYTGIDSYWLRQEFTDHLPACLFELPNLNILHLSGNGFVSSIPQGVNISSKLSDLSLSNNKLKGEIPSEIQYKHWQSLDLSYNKLGGTLRSDYPVPADGETTSLEVNRLSAMIPRALTDVKLISLLDGNLFACSPDRSELPVHDSSVNDYECGSTTLNYALYVWIGIGVIILAVGCVAGFVYGGVGKQIVGKCHLYMSVYSDTATMTTSSCHSDSLVQFGSFLSDLRSFCVLSVAVLFPASLLVNIALSVHFNSYAYEYAWNIASVYLSGTTPAVVLFWLYLAAAVFVTFAARRYNVVNNNRKHKWSAETTITAAENSWSLSQYMSVSLSVLFNVAVIVGVNIAFVFVNQTCSYDAVQATQVALSVFKVAWNNLAVRSVLRQMKQNAAGRRVVNGSTNRARNVSRSSSQQSAAELQQFVGEEEYESVTNNSNRNKSNRNKSNSSSSSSNLEGGIRLSNTSAAVSVGTTAHSLEVAVFIMLFNNLAAPFIAIALVNSNCFYNVITTPPAVSVSYLYASCNYYSPNQITGELQCQAYVYGTDERTTSYIPPFTYSHQCSSAFITTYAPVYILMFIIMSFMSPAALALLKYGHSRTSKGSTLHNTLSKMLPNILKPAALSTDTETNRGSGASSSTRSTNWENTVAMSLLDVVFSKSLFDCDVFVVQVVSILAVALTFEVVFPPILVVSCIALLSVTYCTQLLIGRYVNKMRLQVGRNIESRSNMSSSASECADDSTRDSTEDRIRESSSGSKKNSGAAHALSVCICAMERDVEHAKDMFLNSVHIAVPFAVVFYSFLLFDTLGDDVGWERAVWMPVVLFGIAFVWWVAVRCSNNTCCGPQSPLYQLMHNTYIATTDARDDGSDYQPRSHQSTGRNSDSFNGDRGSGSSVRSSSPNPMTDPLLVSSEGYDDRYNQHAI